VLAENDSYYFLGFKTTKPTTDGKYRRLDFKVPGHGDYIIRSRKGYQRPVAAPVEGSSADRHADLPRPPRGVNNLLASSDVTLQAAAAAFAMPGGARNAIVIALDLTHPISRAPGSGTEELDLRTVAYEAGDPKQDLHTRKTIDVPAGASRVTAYAPLRVDVTPGQYELWLTAHDARTNLIGGVTYDIEVPDFAAHAVFLSGVVLGAEPEAGVTLPAVLAGVVPIIPTSSRIFGQRQPVTAFFRIYQGVKAELAPASLRIRVLDDRGTAKARVDESIGLEWFSKNRAADYSYRLPLTTLAPGRYLLSIEAQVGDRISPKRDVPFSVR
jgi:hypothetical protein